MCWPRCRPCWGGFERPRGRAGIVFTHNYLEQKTWAAELAKRVTDLTRVDLPKKIKTNAQRSLYHNLGNDEELSVMLDAAVHYGRRADWRGNTPSENLIKQAMYEVLKDKKKDPLFKRSVNLHMKSKTGKLTGSRPFHDTIRQAINRCKKQIDGSYYIASTDLSYLEALISVKSKE